MTTARDELPEANQTAPAVGIRLDRPVRPVSEARGLLAQIEACRREVADWPAHMRVVAVLRLHPAAMDWSD